VPRRTASSSNAVGRPVLPPCDVALTRRRACAGTWALGSGHPARWAASHHALGHEPAVRMGCARQDRGLRVTVPLGRGGFGPLVIELFFYFLNIFKSLQIQKFV
jgi:hypothetical protein